MNEMKGECKKNRCNPSGTLFFIIGLIFIDEDTFVLCMQKATTMRKNRYTYLHEIDLSTDRVKNVYKELVKEL